MLEPDGRVKQILAGELDAQRPPYEEITAWLQRVPMTYLPGLLIVVVQQCVLRKVFKPGGLLGLVKRAALRAGESAR